MRRHFILLGDESWILIECQLDALKSWHSLTGDPQTRRIMSKTGAESS